MKNNNRYQQKHLKKSFQQNSDPKGFLTITSEEMDTILNLLFKIGIWSDMNHRGISKFEDYVDVLIKEFSPKKSLNPLQ